MLPYVWDTLLATPVVCEQKAERDGRKVTGPLGWESGGHFCGLSCPLTVSLGKAPVPPLASTLPLSKIWMLWTKWSQTAFSALLILDFFNPSEDDHQLLILTDICIISSRAQLWILLQYWTNVELLGNWCFNNSIHIYKAWLLVWSYFYAKKLSKTGQTVLQIRK